MGIFDRSEPIHSRHSRKQGPSFVRGLPVFARRFLGSGQLEKISSRKYMISGPMNTKLFGRIFMGFGLVTMIFGGLAVFDDPVAGPFEMAVVLAFGGIFVAIGKFINRFFSMDTVFDNAYFTINMGMRGKYRYDDVEKITRRI